VKWFRTKKWWSPTGVASVTSLKAEFMNYWVCRYGGQQ
jgi:hypothetical protein